MFLTLRRSKLMFALAMCAAGLCATATARAAGPETSPADVAAMLNGLHPDYTSYIGEVRYGRGRLRPLEIYAGLVRHGGMDPREPKDAPESGAGAINDLVVYSDTFEPWRTSAWRLLLTDHEYFHARHIARGFPIPVVGFSDPQAGADYCEALAWGYVLERAGAGFYGPLSASERAEVEGRYREHFERFRRWVMKRQPPAWAHYGRFFIEPDALLRSAASTQKAETSLAAGRETR